MIDTLQHAFAAALLDPHQDVPAGILGRDARERDRRFAIYRNNVMVSLIDALRTRFPACERIVGEEFFLALASHHAREAPPRSPLMFEYGDGFADFIAACAPARDIPYLADVARIEIARTRAYHAADVAPLQPDALATQPPDALAQLSLRLHPSLTALTSPHPAVTIWRMNAGHAPLSAIASWQGEDAVIARPFLDVEVHAFAPGAATFLHALAHQPLGAAAETTLAAHPDFELATTLARLLAAGAFVAPLA